MTELTQQRKEFERDATEAFGGKKGKLLNRHPTHPDEYEQADVQAGWQMWQAGRSSLESENAELKKQLTYFDELQAHYGKNWHTEVANRLELMQERDLLKESIKAANERLDSQGLVPPDWPMKGWHMSNRPKPEQSQEITDTPDLRRRCTQCDSGNKLRRLCCCGDFPHALNEKCPTRCTNDEFHGPALEAWVIEAARQILVEIALEKPRLRTSRIAEIIQAARGSSPAPSPECPFCRWPMSPEGNGVFTCNNGQCKAPEYTPPLASPAVVTPLVPRSEWDETVEDWMNDCLKRICIVARNGCKHKEYTTHTDGFRQHLVLAMARCLGYASSEAALKVSELEAQLQQAGRIFSDADDEFKRMRAGGKS